MKKSIVYIIIELLLVGLTCYLFATWNERVTASWIDMIHGTLGIISLVLHIALIITVYISFCRHTNKYPRNDLSAYAFDPKKSRLGYKEEGNYIIEAQKNDEGLWEVKGEDELLIFDMTGYICPKLYICTYFIRNIHYAVINKNKYPFIKMFKSLNLHPYSKYQNVDLLFHYNGKTYKRRIINNNKSRVTWLMRIILRSKYYLRFMFRLEIGQMRKNYIKVDEETFNK